MDCEIVTLQESLLLNLNSCYVKLFMSNKTIFLMYGIVNNVKRYFNIKR